MGNFDRFTESLGIAMVSSLASIRRQSLLNEPLAVYLPPATGIETLESLGG